MGTCTVYKKFIFPRSLGNYLDFDFICQQNNKASELCALYAYINRRKMKQIRSN